MLHAIMWYVKCFLKYNWSYYLPPTHLTATYCKWPINRRPQFHINASYLINTPSTLLKLYWMPLSNKHPYENYSKILGISKKGKIIRFIQFLALRLCTFHLFQCSMIMTSMLGFERVIWISRQPDISKLMEWIFHCI